MLVGVVILFSMPVKLTCLFTKLDSPFQLQEHLKALHYHHTRPSDEIPTIRPITRESAKEIAVPPPNVDRSLWLYELCRLLVMKANFVTVLFFREDPPCSGSTCPEMRASEWQYLCAVHEPPKSCCAIDYCCHTLEWAADTLTSTKNFPSRLSLGGETPGAAQGAVRQLTNIMRRVYRIFAHAWFSHRDVFWQLENEEGLYMLFKTVCDEYHLIPEENYTVPPEAEGLAAKKEEDSEARSLLRKQDNDAKIASEEGEEKTTLSTGATTRRHKQTPSLGSSFTTIQESDEDDRGSETPANKGQDALASSLERSSIPSAPTPEDPSPDKIPEAAEKEEPKSLSAEPTAQINNKTVEEQEVTEPAESKPQVKDEGVEEAAGEEGGAGKENNEDEEAEKRPATAVSDKKRPSLESAATAVKTEEPDEKASQEDSG